MPNDAMNLYKVSRTDSVRYEEFDSIVVQAPDEQSARRIHPKHEEEGIYWDLGQGCWKEKIDSESRKYNDMFWTSDLNSLNIELIGKANPSLDKTVIHSSFQAG